MPSDPALKYDRFGIVAAADVPEAVAMGGDAEDGAGGGGGRPRVPPSVLTGGCRSIEWILLAS